MGPDELALADTIDHANPLEVGRLLEEVGKRIDIDSEGHFREEGLLFNPLS